MLNRISTQQIDNSKYYLNTAPQNSGSKKMSATQKAFVAGTSALGMVPVIAYWAKGKGFSLNPVKIAKTNIKDWALFKSEPLDKVINFGWKEILSVAGGSVVGGFLGGIIIDPENKRAKKREFLNQLLGDVIVPIGCVAVGSKLFNKYSATLHKIMPKINSENKFSKIFNTISENIPDTIATLGSLAIGIIAGNKVSNEINEKLYHKEVDRGIKATDFAPHVDDLCMSISMVNEGSTFASKLGRIIPFALLVPGYETGTAREN
ncbi:hypothetical protein J6G99_02760 [bacterium]|nr:hypothetical protein [bacterium]